MVKRKAKLGKKRYCWSLKGDKEDKSQYVEGSILREAGKWSFTGKAKELPFSEKLCSMGNSLANLWYDTLLQEFLISQKF